MQYLVIILLAALALSINRNVAFEDGVRSSRFSMTDEEGATRSGTNTYKVVLAFLLLVLAGLVASGHLDLERMLG